MRFTEAEVPGERAGESAPAAPASAPEALVKLERVGAEVQIVRRHGTSFRCLTFLGVDGSERRFLVQTSRRRRGGESACCSCCAR